MGLISRALNLEITTSHQLDEYIRRGDPTYSGFEVSREKSLRDSGWFASSRNIAEDIAKLPFIVYEEGEQRTRATQSPFWPIIHDQFATGWSSQQFREYMTFWASQDGDAFGLKIFVRGALREVVPFKRNQVTLEEDDGGFPVYKVHMDGRLQTLTRREVFHLPGFRGEHAGGLDMYELSREDIALSLAIERHGASFFGNKAIPGGAITHPGVLSDEAYDRLKESVQNEMNRDKAFSTLLLEEGMGWQQFGVDHEKSQFLESRKFEVNQSSRRMRIPPHKVSDLERATFSNIEHSAMEYVTDTLLPWALRWENAVNTQLIGQGRGIYAELLFDMLLRGDSSTRSQVYATAIQNGWMTPNEARRRENLPPIPGGDDLLSPLALATATDRELNQLQVRSTIATALVTAGWNPDDVLAAAGLPPMRYEGSPADVQPVQSSAAP